MLTPRQEAVLRKVVEAFLSGGQPVASKMLAADPELDCGPSTIRNELALLEEHGLLAHPHTSAGRVPTDAGHRYVVDMLLAAGGPAQAPPRLELSLIRREVDEAMRVTTETLSQVTNLLAIVSGPSAEIATIRHIEVLTLQPTVVMVVVISSAGNVSKYVCTFESPVDPGLIAWGGEYVNEQLGGRPLGARMHHQRLADPTLGAREREFLERIEPAFSEAAITTEDTLYIDGTSRLLGTHRFDDVTEINDLMELLERRVALLDLLRRTLAERGVYVRIGHENDVPALQSMSLVAAGYGLARRRLGAVSVIGPVRMDYGAAIGTVRAAALQLSRFVEDVYDS
jgi:heat-inducible transcriptional repressor